MSQGPDADRPLSGVPTFHVMARQPIRPAAVVLAVVAFFAALVGIGSGLKATRRHHSSTNPLATRATSPDDDDDDKDDDPSKVDVVYVGDQGDAPQVRRPGKAAYRAVHPTIMVALPRFGPHEGLIPDSTAGHLLYQWLAAFNQSNAAALDVAVPSALTGLTSSALLALRFKTGGLRLLSAREIEPGVMVFRLQDQTPDANEFLGTVRVREGSQAMESFGLRAVEVLPDKAPR